ncbi:MAG TPA: energy transducer TonB [Cyclobacteriaceae bacterium]|nr:energy transducer TonB [Cyclobacteriaceae bacterium]HRJ82886.1 energy transducer TonB [Cyclobacteriaceae bacterium]
MVTLRYPADARRFGTQGKVLISVIITKDGRITDETVEKGLGHGLDEEALRVIQQIPDEWIPGTVNGETTDIKMIIPVTFRLG